MKENSPNSLTGKLLCNIERGPLYNLKLFIAKHDASLEVIFLLIYVLLQIFLMFMTDNKEGSIAIGLFIILFLFFLSLERIIIHVKMNIDREKLQKNEKLIKEEMDNFSKLFYKTKWDRDYLQKENIGLKKQIEDLIRELNGRR